MQKFISEATAVHSSFGKLEGTAHAGVQPLTSKPL